LRAISRARLLAPVAVAAAAALLAGCGGGDGKPGDKPAAQGAKEAKAKRVALIGNQRFGDQGPMDDMARGLERCASEFGFQTRRIESIETAAHEDDIRAVAGEGYDLVFTTFPQMTPATSAVAAEFPDTKFGAVYQFINVGGKSTPNIWDTEYRGDSSYYIAGAIAATLSKNHRIGFVAGGEDPTINASLNAYIQGAKDTDSATRTEFAFANSYEDPAKGKEIALAMASRGVDFVTTAAAKTQLGVIAAAKEKGLLFFGDVADNSKEYPKGFVGFVGTSFGQNVYLGCKGLEEGSFQAGKHTFLDLTNDGYSVPHDVIEKWGAASGRADDAKAAVEVATKLEAKAKDGSLQVAHKTAVPKS
jgi:basic membrane protein A